MKIELKHIYKEYKDVTPLLDVNAIINDGDIISIIGPSGCGKSTLLRCINLLEQPTSGDIFFDGLEITKNKANFDKVHKKMGMVFQSFYLFEHLTVIENVMFSLIKIKKMSKQKAYEIAIDKIRQVGLEDTILKYPDELSGGQKQRISIARTLAMDPDIILFDEPTSALDPTMVREVESVIINLAKMGKTMIIVTHEMRLAKEISNRVFYLDKGIIYESGTPDDIFNNPKKERTKAFVNNLKIYKYKFNSNEFSYERFHSDINKFIENNNIEKEEKKSLIKLTEDVSNDFIPIFILNNSPITILVEKDNESDRLMFIIYCNIKNNSLLGKINDSLKEDGYDFNVQSITDEEFNYKICISI